MKTVVIRNYKHQVSCKIWKYIVVFLIPVICMVIHMTVKDCYPFGTRTILIGDASYQYYAFLESLIQKIKSGGSFLYSWNGGMGYDYYTNFFYYLASPFNLLAIVIGLWDLEVGVASVMIIQTALCGTAMLYYLTHTKVNKLDAVPYHDALCVVLALAYSMSGYMLNYLYNYIWLISLIMAPVVMLGVERLVHENRIGLYYVSMVIVFITNFYFAWFICILAFFWFVDQVGGGLKKILCNTGRFMGVSIISALSASVVLVPCYMAVLGRQETEHLVDSSSIGNLGNFANFIQSFFWAHYVDKSVKTVQFYPELGYCGIFVVVLCLAYLFNRGIQKRQKIKRIVEILFLSFCLNWYWGVFIFHGFTIPHLLFGRFEFILILILLVTAKDMLSAICSVKRTHGLIITLLGLSAILVGMFFNDNTQNLICYMGSVLFFVYVGICFVLYDKKSIGKKALLLNIIVVALLELVSNFFLGNVNTYSTSIKNIIASDTWKEKYIELNLSNGERKTAFVNTTSYITYTDTDIFASSINVDILNMFKKLGLTYQWNGSSYVYKGVTPLTAAMYNVRYVLTDTPAYYGGYDIVSTEEIIIPANEKTTQLSLCENQYMVGLGYTLPENLSKWDTSGNPFDVQNSFTRDVLGVGEIFESFSLDSVDISSETCTIYDVKDLQCSYQNVKSYDYGDIEYSFIVPENMDMYVYVEDHESIVTDIYVDNDLVVCNSNYPSPGEMIHIGNVVKGQNVIINAKNFAGYGDCGTTNIIICRYNDSVMDDCMEILRSEELNICYITDTKVEGTLEASENCMLYTSIPYYKGWTVHVDGEKKTISALGGGVCGVELDKGEHEVIFRYCTYGLRAGSVMSIIGIILSIFMFAYRRRN